MEISETPMDDDRLGKLERQVRDMDARIRNLIGDLLDTKKVVLTLYPLQDGPEPEQAADLAGSASLPGAVPAAGSTVIPPAGEGRQDAPAEPVMVWIMQPDGTMKQEPRYGN